MQGQFVGLLVWETVLRPTTPSHDSSSSFCSRLTRQSLARRGSEKMDALDAFIRARDCGPYIDWGQRMQGGNEVSSRRVEALKGAH